MRNGFPSELATQLKEAKSVLIMAGALCDEISFNGKSLLDYVADISTKIGSPIAATGTTILGLKKRGVARIKKMWAAEVANYMRYPWKDSVSESKPGLIVLIGYNPSIAQKLISTVKDVNTMFLGNVYLEEATYSLPDASSLQKWQKNLEQLIQAL